MGDSVGDINRVGVIGSGLMGSGIAEVCARSALADLIGLDTLQAIADSLHAEYADASYAAPPLLRRLTAAGLLGRKTGRGFHDYQEKR